MSDRREDGPEAAHLGAGRDRAGRGTTNSVTIGRDTGWGTRFLTTIHGTPYLPNPLAGAGSGSGLNTPQTGSLGGTGDRIVFWPGASGAYPYSMGMNSSTLWLSIPTPAVFKFYNNGVMTQSFDQSGYANLGANSSYNTYGLRIAGWDYGNTVHQQHLAYPYGNIGISVGNSACSVNSVIGGTIKTSVNSSGLVVNGSITLANGIWHNSADGVNRFWFDTSGRTYFREAGNTGYAYRNTAQGDIVTIDDGGNVAASRLTLGSSMKANLYYCTASSTPFQTKTGNGGTVAGYFIEVNNWWYLGYSYLTISASVTLSGGNNAICWFCRAYLSPNGTTVLVNGGVMGITPDYSNPSSGGYQMIPNSGFDGAENDFIFFTGSFLASGNMTYKIYG